MHQDGDLPTIPMLILNFILLFERIILYKVNHNHNLVFRQIVQIRFKLCILPFGFKIVNDKFGQLGLEKGNEFKWGGLIFGTNLIMCQSTASSY